MRVSAAPDARTIRYYTTLGLLDRPIIEGRVAKYHRRHLLQVIAIKSLQTVGMPLSEIQTLLYGLSDSELETVTSSCEQSQKAAARSKSQSLPKSLVWHEIVIEPGLKIMAQANWQDLRSGLDEEALEARIRAAISQLKSIAPWANGGQ